MRILAKRILILLFISLAYTHCTTQKKAMAQLKGRLEVKGPCAHYIVKVISGKVSKQEIEKKWTSPVNGKQYTNVFTVENYCSFPADLKEGDEFYFEFVNEPEVQKCIRCMIFVATPLKQHTIKVQPLQ